MKAAGELNIAELETRTREDLMDIAKELGISGYSALKKQDLIFRLLRLRQKEATSSAAACLRSSMTVTASSAAKAFSRR
jgi:transcription termination factor Rho